MKKFIIMILLCVLILPFMVNANECDNDKISITSISIDDFKNTEELTEASANGLDINLHLKMFEVDDFITYKIVVKNDSDTDYKLDSSSFNVSSDYVDYIVESSDDSYIIKANSSKEISLKVVYSNEVDSDTYESGIYNDNKDFGIILKSIENIIINPETGNSSYLFIISIVLLIILSTILFVRRQNRKAISLLIIGSIVLPFGVWALCQKEIKVYSVVEFEEPVTCVSFAEDSWDMIAKNVRNNNICYQVGDTKEVEVEGFGVHTVRIANMSTPSECSSDGFSQTACGFVVEFSDIITTHTMNNGTPPTNVGGWDASALREYLNNDIYNAFPEDLKNNIISTFIVSGHATTPGEVNFQNNDKLYLLSTKEIYGKDATTGVIRYDTAEAETRQLDYYKEQDITTANYSGAIKKNGDKNDYWWLRTAYNSGTYSFYVVGNIGTAAANVASYTRGVCPVFRIG